MSIVQRKRLYMGTAIVIVTAAIGLMILWSRLELKGESVSISILECGATANDQTDDHPAITECLNKAKEQGKSVKIPEGQFLLGDILTLDGVSVQGEGSSVSILTSTNPERGSIDIKGDHVTLSKLKHTYETVVPRGNGANEKNSITVRGATQFILEDLHIQKASTAGILVRDAASHGIIKNNIVQDTHADGIHITDGSSQIEISNNVVKATGDDTIAVVSYLQDGQPAHNITIRDNDVGYGSQARGITVVGGFDILIEGNLIQDTQMAGIYISVEKEWKTADTERININKNTVDNTGIREPHNHPNVLVYASQGKIDEVAFRENVITNSPHGGIGVWGDGMIGDVYFYNNILSGSAGEPVIFKNGKIHIKENSGF